jgi:hypothetical protein
MPLRRADDDAQFLGTGDFRAAERYWNAFVIDGRILVESSPTVVPHLADVA